MELAGAPDGSGYFLYHSIGMYPDKAARVTAALARIAATWGTPDDGQWPLSLRIRQEFIARWRALIQAPEGTLTTAENVTAALYSLIGALPEKHLRGRQLLIAADCFPSLHFLLAGMAQRRGFELVTVPVRPGEHWVRDEDFVAQWGPSVGVALLTWVTSTTSHRCDLRALAAHGHAQGSLVGVDITQGVGILPFTLADSKPDFVVGSSLKWLGGVAGAGILQVQPALLKECTPELRGWFSQDDPFCWALDRFAYARDARRFDSGTPSVLACAGSLPALEWHAGQETLSLLAHNRGLTEMILDGAAETGLDLLSPRRADDRGGSLMFRLPAEVQPASLIAALRAQQLFADHRGSTLRLSPGAVTTEDGVIRLLSNLRAACARRSTTA